MRCLDLEVARHKKSDREARSENAHPLALARLPFPHALAVAASETAPVQDSDALTGVVGSWCSPPPLAMAARPLRSLRGCCDALRVRCWSLP